MIDRVRRCALRRGARGIVGLSRSFRIMDDDRSFKLSYEELKKGLRDYGFRGVFTESELDTLCATFDRDEDGHVSVDEFLRALRPPMDAVRRGAVDKAWTKADANGDGQLTVLDLEARYDVSGDPRFLTGEKSKDELFRAFLDEFDTDGSPDGLVTKDEFVDYYAGISAGIDDSMHFDLLLRNAWKV
jgi:Ca2+-binding EF-hand superfamily protein